MQVYCLAFDRWHAICEIEKSKKRAVIFTDERQATEDMKKTLGNNFPSYSAVRNWSVEHCMVINDVRATFQYIACTHVISTESVHLSLSDVLRMSKF